MLRGLFCQVAGMVWLELRRVEDVVHPPSMGSFSLNEFSEIHSRMGTDQQSEGQVVRQERAEVVGLSAHLSSP